LLLGEVVKVLLSASDGVGGLNSASGGESKVGAAAKALILNGVNVASSNPVNFCRGVGNTVVFYVIRFVVRQRLVNVEGIPLCP